MTPHRYPLASLIEASRQSYDNARRTVGASGTDWTRAARDGILEAKADRWAVKLGLVPFEVWPDWLDDAFRPCTATGCPNRFAPYRDQDLYCSRTCARRERVRRHRATEHGRAQNAEACRRYKADVAASRARRAS